MQYIPSSPNQIEQMLKFLGIESVDQLFKDIPKAIALKNGINIREGICEKELIEQIKGLANKNQISKGFLGAGYYGHYIPSPLNYILTRSELFTAYTPYQAELSQGVLQALFEYQSIICELTGQEVSNATMYDGPTALAESCVMAHRKTKRDKIIVSESLHPRYRQVLQTYSDAGGLTLETKSSISGLSEDIIADKDTAAVVVQTPNYFGNIEKTDAIYDLAEDAGALTIAVIAEATSLSLLKPPQADIVCGEGQALGNPLSFGGPGFGFLATNMQNVRNMPGRLVGHTLDLDGKDAYALTLQAREQHIRREKATSNICTSQSLCAIAAAAYVALMGPKGLKTAALNSHKIAKYLRDSLAGLNGFEGVFDLPFYNEFCMRVPEDIDERIAGSGYVAGVRLDEDYPRLKDGRVFAATEANSFEQVDELVRYLS